MMAGPNWEENFRGAKKVREYGWSFVPVSSANGDRCRISVSSGGTYKIFRKNRRATGIPVSDTHPKKATTEGSTRVTSF